ncbi:MAG: tetratricopeptide repeat protein [Ruaniaceae bacterium]|nr:tetratricopeptide repeat protein [Ruaniaceae bacterium]
MTSLNMHGAIDLSGLGAPPPAPVTGGAVVDVTDATFGQIVEQSRTVPVVLNLWAEWSEPSMALESLLERLAAEHAGRFLVARVNVEANPQIVGAFQVQSIPAVIALIAAQPVTLFQGAQPEAQVRQIIEQLLAVAKENGVTGTVPMPESDAEPEPEPEDPAHVAASELVEAGDWDGAKAAYEAILANAPADGEAQAALRFVNLFGRLGDADLESLIADAGEDAESQLAAADAEAAMADFGAAFRRLLALVRAGGDARESARARLVELFEIAGNDHPEVAGARRELTNALY